MADYKFRGKRKDNGERVEGYYCKIWNKHYIILDRGMPYSPCGEDSCFYKDVFERFVEVIGDIHTTPELLEAKK